MKHALLALLPLALGFSFHARADDAQALGAWKSGPLPFSFTYNGKSSAQITGWTKTEETLPSEGGVTHRYTYLDPATALMVVAEVRTFNDFPAIDWVLHFTNEGQKDTPIIEDLKPLDWTLTFGGITPAPVLHWAQGSNAAADDFAPHDSPLAPSQTVTLNSTGGRSSNNMLPFFNVQSGTRGMFGAIGWTGNWIAHFAGGNDGKYGFVKMDAGMQHTHFLLHSGETVRTPRIVLLDWHGDRTDAQNLWRQFVLAHYSPRQPDGSRVTLPVCLGTWGSESVDDRKKTIDVINKYHVPLDCYWVDAGWYGHGDDWAHQRGNWTPNPAFFPPPDGLRALGGYLHGNNLGFVLWLEAETADPGSDMLTKHPDWYLRTDPNGSALLNLGNLDALNGMTGLLSSIITPSFISWYRQDFNIEPDGYWAKNDAPDRVGVTEMEDIAGLYAYWDELRRSHPGLQIDNCASGGRRLDIETMSRSVSLWRSDYCCSPYENIGNQDVTQGLNIWVPLNAGDDGPFGGPTPQQTRDAEFAGGNPVAGAATIYTARSAYSAGLTFGSARPLLTLMAPMVREFDQLRPYATGDFYPLTPYSADPATWCVLQWHRPDLKAGAVVYLRRQGSNDVSMHPALQAIDPQAQYEVEVRSSFVPVAPQTMSGADLAKLTVTIDDKPGSTIVFYKQK
jgi:alpha-galactosidase